MGWGRETFQLPLQEVQCGEIVALKLHTKSTIFILHVILAHDTQYLLPYHM